MLPLVAIAAIVAGGVSGLRVVLKRSVHQASEEAKVVIGAAIADFGEELDKQRDLLRKDVVSFADAFAVAARKAFEDRPPMLPPSS